MDSCVLFCCLGMTDRNETELHSRQRNSDSRTAAACDGHPDHVLVGIGGDVDSLFIVVALLVSRALGFFCMRAVQQNQRNLYECGSHLTQGLLHVLPISNLQNSWVSSCLLVYSSIVLLALCSVFLGRGLPSMGSTYNLARCILTKVSKS
jgi:branched-subunit amino acid transport protein AzlD